MGENPNPNRLFKSLNINLVNWRDFFLSVFIENKKMLTYNIKFPLEDNISKNSFFQMNSVTKDALASNLMLLLLTERGERYYMPDYGSNLLQFIFEPKDGQTILDVKEEIKQTVSKYISQLNINEIEFKQNADDDDNPIKENELSVIIRFTYTEDTFVDSGMIELNF